MKWEAGFSIGVCVFRESGKENEEKDGRRVKRVAICYEIFISSFHFHYFYFLIL